MRHLTSIALAGVAALALAGTAAFAAAKDNNNLHEMTVSLPNGGVAQIQYTGNVAPHVTVRSGPFDTAWPAFADFGYMAPFPVFDPWPAAMDRQMDILFRRAQALALAPWPSAQGLNDITSRNLPPGSQSFAVTTTSLGDKICTRTVQMTKPANGGAPHVVAHQTGDCTAQSGSAQSTALPFEESQPDTAAIPISLRTISNG